MRLCRALSPPIPFGSCGPGRRFNLVTPFLSTPSLASPWLPCSSRPSFLLLGLSPLFLLASLPFTVLVSLLTLIYSFPLLPLPTLIVSYLFICCIIILNKQEASLFFFPALSHSLLFCQLSDFAVRTRTCCFLCGIVDY